jgi:predicted dehydrogenase
MTRREMMKTAAAAAALTAANHARAQGANGRVRIGTVGCGGMAVDGHIKQLLQCPDAEIVALADVDDGKAGHTAGIVEKASGRRPRTFRDFRQLLELKDIDAVNIGTPDHWHALVFIHACQAGKDVYCEKPVSHNVVEGRAMVNAALKHRRVVQIGTQCRSSAHLQEAIRVVRSGLLGRIVETQTWTTANAAGMERKPDGDPPPDVDYDFWLGPAPKRAFNPNRFHFTWRWFSDYGGGLIADLNVHIQDIVHLAMDAWHPRSVCATGQIAHADDPRDTPDTLQAVYEFDSAQGPFTHVYTARRTNNYPPDGDPDHGDRGILFCGRNGSLFADYGHWTIRPEGDRVDPESGKGGIPLMPHIRNFLDCIKSRAKTTSDIESMHATTTACHLANVSHRVGRRIHWDAKIEKCFRDRELKVPDEEANALLGREYRPPWTLPG